MVELRGFVAMPADILARSAASFPKNTLTQVVVCRPLRFARDMTKLKRKAATTSLHNELCRSPAAGERSEPRSGAAASWAAFGSLAS